MSETTIVCSCGAAYRRIETKLIFPERGKFECRCCGKILERWHDLRFPRFELIKMPDTNGVDVLPEHSSSS